MGLGIRGEPGVDLIDFSGAKAVAEILCERLFRHVGKAAGYALLLNNLGSTTLLEMGVLANEFLSSGNGKKIKLVIGPGLLVTSLDMHGFSASLLPSTATTRLRLLPRSHPQPGPAPRFPANCGAGNFPRELKPRRKAKRQCIRGGVLVEVLRSADCHGNRIERTRCKGG